jgi:K+-transporting ATPase KdpF subunit
MPEAQMIMMALMLFVIVVSYVLMLGLVKFAVSVIDKALPAKLRDAISSDTNGNARSLWTTVHFGAVGGHHSNEAIMVAVYLLALIVVFLVVYLFYAVINPERFWSARADGTRIRRNADAGSCLAADHPDPARYLFGQHPLGTLHDASRHGQSTKLDRIFDPIDNMIYFLIGRRVAG